MSSTSKMMDYVSFMNSRLEKLSNEKYNLAEKSYNQKLVYINSTLCKEKEDLKKINFCPSDIHRLSIKYLGYKSSRGRFTDREKTKLTLKHIENDNIKYNIQSHDVLTKPLTEIPHKGNLKLQKSLTFFSKPYINSIPDIPIRSSTILKDNKQNDFTDSYLPQIFRKTSINLRVKKFVISINEITDDNILQDCTTTQEYWKSISLTKADFQRRKKMFYDSRKSSLVTNPD